jgi:hypothetical protein
VKLAFVVLAMGASTLAAGAGPARATNECRGLQVCVRVAGPWVVVPAAQGAERPRVEFQLSCPRGFIVGGLDAELSDRALDIAFLAKLGSPVNPGVSTSRAAVFIASYTGGSRRTATFRPHIGCIPASGGSGGPVPFRNPNARALSAVAFPPGQPTTRRVRTLRLRAGATQTAVRGCAGSERLVRGWHAVGFYTARAPDAGLVASVTATRTTGAGRVKVTARSGAAVRGIRAVVQVGAVCAGGS